MTRFPFILTLCSLLSVAFIGGTPPAGIILVNPSAADSVCSGGGRLLLVSVSKDFGTDLIVSPQWEKERLFPLESKADREGFAKEFYKLIEPGATLQQVTWSFKYFAGYARPETLTFSRSDTVTLRAFWSNRQFTDMVRMIQLGNASAVILTVRGWKDTLVTTAFDDPGNDARALFKLSVRLLPGENDVYLTTPSRPQESYDYHVRLVRDAMPVEGKQKRFHGTGLETGCAACHEGLEATATGMTADCASCHKALASAEFVHAPVEMKECGTCHTLAAGKGFMSVEKGTPAACVECHVEKQTLLDSAAIQHPVASDCTGCHDPHSSPRQHLLKVDVYRLCIECHADYAINHPVGKHPLRFVKVKETNAEISCVSCHNPHGSANPALLKGEGGPMEICLDCHQS